MLNKYARAFTTRVIAPIARLLLRLGLSPDAVTLVGAAGVILAALAFYPRGLFVVGTLVITFFIFSDLLDGTMARLSGRSSRWGAFLDSTLDRLADGAIFGGLALYYAGRGSDTFMAGLALYCLVTGAAVSYSKARAEGLGMKCDVSGLVERSERMLIVLVATLVAGLGVPYILAAGLWILAVGSTITLVQRMLTVRKEAFDLDVGTPR